MQRSRSTHKHLDAITRVRVGGKTVHRVEVEGVARERVTVTATAYGNAPVLTNIFISRRCCLRAICLQTPYIKPGGVALSQLPRRCLHSADILRHATDSDPGITISYELKRHVHVTLPTCVHVQPSTVSLRASWSDDPESVSLFVVLVVPLCIAEFQPTGRKVVRSGAMFGEREMSYGRKFLCSRFSVQWHADYSVMQFPKHLSFALNAYSGATRFTASSFLGCSVG